MPNKSVLLVNPNRMRPPIAPLGLEYCAAAIKRAGYEPILCDLAFAPNGRAALEEALGSARPLAVAVSIRNLDDAYLASQDFVLEEAAQTIAQIRAISRAPLILGGVGFSAAPWEVLRYTGADYGIVGEGESGLPPLLACLAGGGNIFNVPGAVFKDEGGRITGTAPAHADLPEMPAPSRRFVDNPRYFAEGGQAGLETKRGCAQRCVYCVEPMAKGRLVRLRSPESVVEEVRDLFDQGIDVLHLCDSEFNLPLDHAHAVCAALENSGLGARIRWYAYAYPKFFDGELASAMRRAGCAGINFGVDHADETMLRRLGRHYGPEDIRRTAQACHNGGLAVMFDMLLGGPGETRQSLARAIDFVRSLAVDRVGLSCGVRVYPHTPLAELVRAQGPPSANPNLQGTTADNDDLLRPIFYVDAALDGDIHALVGDLVGGDRRFLHADPRQIKGNYNYNDNSALAEAIRAGERGAYWYILQRLEERAAAREARAQ